MQYLIAQIEKGTPIEELRLLGPIVAFTINDDEDLDEHTEIAVAALAERERIDSDQFEVLRVPLESGERLTIGSKRKAVITDQDKAY